LQSNVLTSPGRHEQQSFGITAAGPPQPPTQHSWPIVQLGGQFRCIDEALLLEAVAPPVPVLASGTSRDERAPHAAIATTEKKAATNRMRAR